MKLESKKMTTREVESKSIERVERAFRARMDAFLKMNTQFYPSGSGEVSDEALNEFDSADAEWKSAISEMDRMAAEIRSGARE